MKIAPTHARCVGANRVIRLIYAVALSTVSTFRWTG
jgi:hypothetical protein